LITEALLVPFGLISIPIIRFCMTNWPARSEQSVDSSLVGDG
jgi:hypothetical protein